MLLIDKYDLFIFDFDGTLSTSTFLARITRHLKRRYDLEYVRKHEKEFRDGLKGPEHLRKDANDVYSYLYDFYAFFFRPRIMDDAIAVLDYLKNRRKKVAVFSDANFYRLMGEARMLRVTGHVDMMLSAQSIKFFKPSPAGIQLILEKFRKSKSRCLYVGDMATDVLTARFAGIDCCAIYSGVDSYERIMKVKPKYAFKDLPAFMRGLKKPAGDGRH